MTKKIYPALTLFCFLLSAPVLAQPAAPQQASPAPSPSATTPELQVAVVGLRDTNGRVTCSLFNDPLLWPRGDEYKVVTSPIHGDAALCVFKEIPAGKYALIVYHDENANGHFDQNAFGMPLEGYGFSNNAAALFDAPSFGSASFDYDGQRLYTVVNMRY